MLRSTDLYITLQFTTNCEAEIHIRQLTPPFNLYDIRWNEGELWPLWVSQRVWYTLGGIARYVVVVVCFISVRDIVSIAIGVVVMNDVEVTAVVEVWTTVEVWTLVEVRRNLEVTLVIRVSFTVEVTVLCFVVSSTFVGEAARTKLSLRVTSIGVSFVGKVTFSP